MNRWDRVLAHRSLVTSLEFSMMDNCRWGSARLWADSFALWRIWTHLGWRDIKVRYALTALGPIWTVVTVVIFVFALGFVYGTLFQADLRFYLPYLAAGIVTWNFISIAATEATDHLNVGRSLLLNTSFPLPVFALAVAWRNFLVFLMSLPVVLVVRIWGIGGLDAALLQLLPGLALLVLVLVFASYLLGILGVLLPDFKVLLPSLLFLIFLSSPIIWSPELLGERTWIYQFNPVYWLIILVRDPLLGIPVSTTAWASTAGVLALLVLLTGLVSRRVTQKVRLLL